MKIEKVTLNLANQPFSKKDGLRVLTGLTKQSNMAPIYYVEYKNGIPVVVDSWARPAVAEDFGPDGMLILDRLIEFV